MSELTFTDLDQLVTVGIMEDSSVAGAEWDYEDMPLGQLANWHARAVTQAKHAAVDWMIGDEEYATLPDGRRALVHYELAIRLHDTLTTITYTVIGVQTI